MTPDHDLLGLMVDLVEEVQQAVQRRSRSSYGPSPIKRARRTKDDISQIKVAIYQTLKADHPQTLRGLFYQLTTQGVVPKTEAAYKTIVGRLTVEMRKAGELPYVWLADNTRWMRKPTSHDSLEEALRWTAQTYRRNLWTEQDVSVEVWLEKDALSGVLYDVTAEYDVPLMVTRGYPSLSFLHSAAEAMRDAGRPTFIYYFGDYDPSGVDIPRKVEATLRDLAPEVDLTFERVAVNPDQIAKLALPTRPTKTTDTRAKGFNAESVEVDAIPAHMLRTIARFWIEDHVDQAALNVLRIAEASERSILFGMAAGTMSEDEP